MLIRPPTFGDIDQILSLGAQMHQESGYARLPYDSVKVRALIRAYIEDQDSRFSSVAVDRGEVIAMIAAYLTDYIFCDEPVVNDDLLFVKASHRGGTVAIRMVRGLERWANARGAREVFLGVSTGIAVERTGRLYQRLGFRHVGGVYSKQLR